ncbi:MAG: PSD1 domain-containing protein [Verrucomicrobiales bacterium]|nr:PSD1 domain-containing protein [Verrucomicrobiales bacterium]
MIPRPLPTFPALALILLAAPVARGAEAEHLAFFETKIRPVLAEKCYSCHSAEAEKLKAGLQVDHVAHLLSGGDSGPAIVVGKPGDSLLMETLRYGNPDLQMPPKSKLDDAVIADFDKWIALGAPWPDEPKPVRTATGEKVDGSDAVMEAFDLEKRRAAHWCWQPVKPTALPAVKQSDWPRRGLDHFILARLEAAGLRPAEDAAPETWLRRVTFDLTGLPPSPAEIAAYLKEKAAEPASDRAEQAVVERLLASPHYGERWARHWMDLARYGETCGHEFDYPIPHAHRYRDYLIDAFNRDLPHDTFLVEHLAGDLLEQPRRDPATGVNQSIQATGFWYLHEAVHAPTDIRGDEAGRIDNQIDVFTKSFLGLTVACARCHDHKFDAIGTADYYAIAGYLQSSRRQEAFLDPGDRLAQAATEARAIHARGQALLRDAFPGLTADQVSRYLIAARRLLDETARQPGADRIEGAFADFEAGYDGWQIEGDAFGDRPATGTFKGQQAVSGFLGGGLVNSWNGSDGKTGRALSPEFTIATAHLHFLIGGGAHAGETCVNLLIDGKPVLTATGKNNEQLEPHTWDLKSYQGKKARLEIVDRATGGWGHINVDHFVFSDSPTFDPAKAQRPLDPALAKRIAIKQGPIDDATLLHWARLLRDQATDDPGHPLHAWKIGSTDPAAVKGLITRQQSQRTAFETARKAATVLADFDGGDADGWTATGFAFDAKPLTATTWAPGLPNGLALPAGVISSATIAPRFHGVLRSPTFTLSHPRIHLRINARAARVRLVIDEHYMNHFHQLLLGGTLLKPAATDTGGEFRWFTMQGNLDKYIGHRVYLEVSDLEGGHIAIDEVLLSNDPLPAAPPSPAFAGEPGESPESLAREIGTTVVASIAAGETDWANLLWREQLWPRHEALTAAAADMAALSRSLPEPLYAVAMLEGTPEDEHIHIRGSHLKLGDPVPRRNLAALGGQPAPREASGRLELARLLATGDNPLVSRVAVNRAWHHLFERGLVPTVDDFGVMGQPPSHPDLLDWLASTYATDMGWSLKSLLREIVLSRTYRMSSAPHPALDRSRLAEIDPENVLLHRAPVRRLQAEAIRDAILAVSGRLDPVVGGPSIPIHLTAFMEGRGRPGGNGPLDGAGRRSLYTEIRRNFLPPFLLTFDMPIPFNAMGRRTVSNVPAQALSMMNDPFVVEQASLLAQRLATDPARSEPERITELFLSAFARQPTDDERQQITSFLASEPNREQAWTDLCHALFNKKEFIYLN